MSTQLNYQNFIKELSDNLKSINQKVLLVAVSKTKPLRDILGLYSLGQRDFGENYAQELRDKIKATTKHQDDISWHYIGQIQQNKIKYFAGKATLVHTVDSLKTASMINEFCLKKNLFQDILLQINVSEDLNKGGARFEEAQELYSKIVKLERLNIKGLMTITEYSKDPEHSRTDYRKMKNLSLDIEKRYGCKLELSMGMSNDYRVALEEGSTIIRVGTKIFGERTK
ncbi:YggS family pyridoxal phosphate-dependent enzyme [bacterium]|jgi:hypothetical protein|nr:YggS family pyridoxal phosphate-dependent enzyme [bacterium]